MQIDIIADTICPWCFIGKRRFERALAMRNIEGVVVSWTPYQLNPEIPLAGMDRLSYMLAKFGDMERVERTNRRIGEAGLEEGIVFNFKDIEQTPNTIDSHRLVRLASIAGKQSTVVDTLYRAYFLEGQDIGDIDVLIDIGVEAGMSQDTIENYLASDDGRIDIVDEDNTIRQMGIAGVPCFIIEGKYAVSGAQAPEIFLQIFDLVEQDRLEDAANSV